MMNRKICVGVDELAGLLSTIEDTKIRATLILQFGRVMKAQIPEQEQDFPVFLRACGVGVVETSGRKVVTLGGRDYPVKR